MPLRCGSHVAGAPCQEHYDDHTDALVGGYLKIPKGTVSIPPGPVCTGFPATTTATPQEQVTFGLSTGRPCGWAPPSGSTTSAAVKTTRHADSFAASSLNAPGSNRWAPECTAFSAHPGTQQWHSSAHQHARVGTREYVRQLPVSRGVQAVP